VRYDYAVDDAVLNVFASVPKRQRERLLRIFDTLGENPFLRGDTVQRDNVGRPCEVKRFGEWTVEWTVIYWSEHIAKKVQILAVEHLKF